MRGIIEPSILTCLHKLFYTPKIKIKNSMRTAPVGGSVQTKAINTIEHTINTIEHTINTIEYLIRII